MEPRDVYTEPNFDTGHEGNRRNRNPLKWGIPFGVIVGVIAIAFTVFNGINGSGNCDEAEAFAEYAKIEQAVGLSDITVLQADTAWFSCEGPCETEFRAIVASLESYDRVLMASIEELEGLYDELPTKAGPFGTDLHEIYGAGKRRH